LPPESLLASPAPIGRATFVPETRFGHWFLGTDTWFQSVLRLAIVDLHRLIDDRKKSYPVVVDVGCGKGRSFRLLKILFRPGRLIGVEMEPENLASARRRAQADRVRVDFLRNDCAAIELPDATADVVLCHQTFHHLVQQERSLSEFHRILKPGGLLLFSESTKAYIDSWIIRLLFAHPMEVQRTAEEYLAMIRACGFEFGARNVSYPYLWWSRPGLGLEEMLGFAPKPRAPREETLVNVVARKSAPNPEP
jgi:ubiquinone/menaquinone biosynthesis C-methylase UbiE